MNQIELKAEPRAITGKGVRHLRRAGFVPAIVYGRKAQPISVQVVERELGDVLHRGGATQIVALTVSDGSQPRMALIREIQYNPLTRAVLHVDFQEVVMTEKLQMAIPLVFEGEPPIVRLGDGIMFHGLNEVEIECLPGDLVSTIRVDLRGLDEVDATMHVRDLEVPTGIKVLTNPDEVVARVLPARVVEEEEELEEVLEEEAPAEVEVISTQKAEQRRAERPSTEEEE